ncbi:MAG: heavy metal translocating P-type ATPase [Pseudobdellovibrio sp.]
MGKHHNHNQGSHDNKNNHAQSHTQSHCCDHDEVAMPHVLAQSLQANDEQVLTVFKVSNMDCADEIKAINEALKMQGVFKIQADLMSSRVQVLHDKTISSETIKEKIQTTVVKVVDAESDDIQKRNKNRILIVSVSGLFLTVGLIMQWLNFKGLEQKILLFISIANGGYLVFPKAFSSLKRKALDMNVLMTVAVIGAVAINEYLEAAAVVFLFSLSELLESLSVQRARKAIKDLLNVNPHQVIRVDENDKAHEVDVSEIKIGDKIRVKAGENIPLDGIVFKGTSSVNQAPLTGESLPVVKNEGDEVYAGTINQEGSLDILVQKLFSDTKISQVIRLVEEAQSQRAVSQKFVDKFSAVYTPAVMILAILTFVIPPLFFSGSWHDWLYKALVLLVIACPCALVISTPVSIVSSLTALARKGVLVKGGAILEMLGKIKALALDKTGTLTEGKPQVQKMRAFNNFSEELLLEIASSLEEHSTHPLAVAIITKAQSKGLKKQSVSNFINRPGRGVQADLNEQTYFLGNKKLMDELNIKDEFLDLELESLQAQSMTVVIVAQKSKTENHGIIVGVIGLGDTIRESTRKALGDLKQAGVSHLIVLSGDNQKTVSSVAQELNLENAYGDLLPEDKVKHIEDLKAQYQFVAMIGDGVNDAPAMAKSSVGIAMGFIGSDTAIETSDVTLMTDDLQQVVTAVKAGRRTLSIIQFNIAFALVTKAVFLVLTFLGYSNLWLAVAADTGAALLVIANSLRLLYASNQH